MEQTKDRYDVAIEYLTEHPNEINDAWSWPRQHEAGCLFLFAGDTDKNGNQCGCVSSVHNGTFEAATDELTNAIRSDSRIPGSLAIKVEHLPVFAEWQRKLDIALNRK